MNKTYLNRWNGFIINVHECVRSVKFFPNDVVRRFDPFHFPSRGLKIMELVARVKY